MAGLLTEHHLLVIDWDYFFEEYSLCSKEPEKQKQWMYFDWGHSEISNTAGILRGPIWVSRAASFIAKGLPLPETTGEEIDFWHRFIFTKDAHLYYSDSNTVAVFPDVMGKRKWSSVWLYDAHHDSGYKDDALKVALRSGSFECENWMLLYYLKHLAKLHVRYPAWKDYVFEAEPEMPWFKVIDLDRQTDDITLPNPITFSRVFVCRSSAWVPSWLDRDFDAFITRAPFKSSRRHVIGPETVANRGFDLREAQALAERLQCIEHPKEAH